LNPDRWQKVKKILDSVMEIPPHERNIFIERASGGEESLCREVKSLIAYKSMANDFLQSPALELAGQTPPLNRVQDLVGMKLGHYLLQHKLGAGGMGEVYLAKDFALGRQAAIKVLPPGIPHGYFSRLVQEAEAAVKLQHPGIATFYESGVDSGIEYIAMEYVAGETLRARLSRGPLGVSSVISLASGLLEALAHAHSAGILHRDIKPENIMLIQENMPKLLDFGLAIQLIPASATDTEATRTQIRGVIAGTLGYMSPEQVRGDADLDERSDLFSLGAVLYECLSGQPAFTGDTGADRLAAVLYKNPTPLTSLGFSSSISEIIDRSLEKDKNRRFPSASVFLREVLKLSDTPVQTGVSNLLAIVDFRNLSNDSADDWLGTGIAETLITDLSKLPSLKIAPRERIVQAYRSSSSDKTDPLAVAQSLGCRWVLEGSFQKMGTMVRITARLTGVATNTVEATEKLDGSIDQIFSMQDRLSASVASILKIQTPSPEMQGNRPILTAYEHYNRGRQFFLGYKKGGFQHAEALYQEAIAIDPRYALAYAGLASINAMKWTYTSDPACLDAAKQHAYRAIELDPSLGEPHIWLGYVLFREGNFNQALEEEQKAGRLSPANHMGPYFEGLILKEMGRLDEAISALQKAMAIDPQFTGAWSVIGDTYMLLDRVTEAIWCLEHIVQLEISNPSLRGNEAGALLGEIYRRTGNSKAAKAACLACLERIESSDHMYRDYARAYCLNILGRCALDEGDRQAASAAFHQSVMQIRGRNRTTAAGYIIILALTGESRSTGNQKLFDEACHIFQNRTGWNFSSGIGNLEGEIAIDIGIAAAELGKMPEAQQWYQNAKCQVVSKFRLGELEKALSH